MNSTKRTTPADRSRALGRLRALTVGTALAGMAAVGAFGTLAAASYSGHTSDPAADVGTTTTTSSSSTTNSTTAAATPTPTATIRPATTNATTTTGGGQVSTGGS